jgi:glutamyl-tRNA synthetase
LSLLSPHSDLSAAPDFSGLPYRGRLAPSPTGFLHLGHARTFWIASERARAAAGSLLLRNDDLDRDRCRPEFVTALQEDLTWLGLQWQEPMITQSERLGHYRAALEKLHAGGYLFPCARSRRDVLEASGAPHADGLDDEPVYPVQFRPAAHCPLPPLEACISINWRFRIPEGETIEFADGCAGPHHAVAGRDFGDFLVWRKDNTPSYQLACAVDDAAFGITEVVRGADLIRSTFRQILLLRALGHPSPRYFHPPLVCDARGVRLAKRHDALSLRTLRAQGVSPEQIIEGFRAGRTVFS